ncbi:MAG: HAD family phosphatase, partial [Flavobacteriaceae bacterium]
MDLSQVKMVVSDMDGTLLNSKSQVSSEFFRLFDELQSHNVHFVAASGRQYTSIHEKLEVISEQITIVAENGGYIRQGNIELGSIHLSADRVRNLLPVLKASEGLYYVVCGKKSAYIDQNEHRFTSILKEYYTRYTVIDDLMNLPD